MVNQDNMQGFDAGGMNYAEAVGLDSSIFDVMNKSGNANLVVTTSEQHQRFITPSAMAGFFIAWSQQNFASTSSNCNIGVSSPKQVLISWPI